MQLTAIDLIETIPEGLLSIEPEEITQLLHKPTLVHIEGNNKDAIFISTLLHGNETTSFYAMQQLLDNYAQKPLPRSIYWFIRNIDATAKNMRRLPHQPDYNRIWPGTDLPESDETHMALELFNFMKTKSIFASIDIHNNTGLNPLYGCINSITTETMFLASLFSEDVIYFIRPKGVQSIAFTTLTPSITIECGLSGKINAPVVTRYIETCLSQSTLTQTVAINTLNVYHTIATVKIPNHISFSFDQQTSDIQFRKQIQQLNFKPLSAGSVIADLTHFDSIPIIAIDEQGTDKTSDYFSFADGKITTKKAIVPAMITLDAKVIRQDCFCYFMEPYKVAL